MKTYLSISLIFVASLSSCKSDARKVIDKGKELQTEYIDDLNNAESAEEVEFLQKKFHETFEFELRKTVGAKNEEEMENIMNESADDVNWEDVKSVKELGEKAKEAEQRARERFEM